MYIYMYHTNICFSYNCSYDVYIYIYIIYVYTTYITKIFTCIYIYIHIYYIYIFIYLHHFLNHFNTPYAWCFKILEVILFNPLPRLISPATGTVDAGHRDHQPPGRQDVFYADGGHSSGRHGTSWSYREVKHCSMFLVDINGAIQNIIFDSHGSCAKWMSWCQGATGFQAVSLYLN